MKTYFVRGVRENPLDPPDVVGIFTATDVTDLFWLIDHTMDPYSMEYKEVEASSRGVLLFSINHPGGKDICYTEELLMNLHAGTNDDMELDFSLLTEEATEEDKQAMYSQAEIERSSWKTFTRKDSSVV